ncbi:tyrosine-protein phosphatase [Enterococcus sp. CSURQ0835]|uniref:tyrosine-protein phosphatase n=1 Tax=Enterococcus sp. CSURQ0835 TaxID=2681394 RepID=UPI0013587280|nr:tyrosine-protein phosphatase [Enterococcus sp. CSURQ0835]
MEISITNFRDLGGICNQKGQKIKDKKLIRSGQLTNVSKEDRQLLTEDYHLRKIIDFRMAAEVEYAPDTVLPGATYVNIDLLSRIDAKNASFTDFLKLSSVEEVDCYLLGVYRELILSPAAQTGWREFLEHALEMEEGALLFHCFAGKDRTGFAAALLLALLEVEPRVIFEDYLATNHARRQANLELLGVLERQGFDPKKLAVIETTLQVKKDYLVSAFQLIEKKFGTFQHYAQVLGFDHEQLKALQKIYLSD